ncbi:DUF2878 domain-containing protein [Pseudoalteromonas sp. SSDWG2]|uniref:DUF2878 domain-containing protein n=1 Tax=Pseudoalteromonas sp. SSDWG2 TaxID=3139391 RepID=UPI003BA89F9A
MTRPLRLIINFLLFQSSWWAAFFFQNDALIVMVGIALVMLMLSHKRRLDALLCGTFILGCVLELVANHLGLLHFDSPLLPLWLAALWVSLILTINHSLDFINSLKTWQCFALCWLVAPLSYLGAARYEVIQVSAPWWSFYLFYGFLWALTFSVIVVINKRLNHVIIK